MGIGQKEEWDERFSGVTLTWGNRGTCQRELHMELEEEPGPSDSDPDGTLIEQAMEALKGRGEPLSMRKPGLHVLAGCSSSHNPLASMSWPAQMVKPLNPHLWR